MKPKNTRSVNPKIPFISTAVLMFLLLVLSAASARPQPENLAYLVNAQSLNAYTGNIITPSPFTADSRKFSFGLHKFNIGVNYGINSSWESGVYINLNELTPSSNGSYDTIVTTSIALHSKYRLMKQSEDGQPFDFSAGFFGKSVYFIIGKQLNDFFELNFEAGVDVYYTKTDKLGYFFSITHSEKYSNFIIDYKSYTGQANIGWRV